jgi:hypothetical protein
MKRREFLKTSAVAAGAAALGAPLVARAQAPETINVGHLVGICMSPLFYARAISKTRASTPSSSSCPIRATR